MCGYHVCVSICLYVYERERDRERGLQSWDVLLNIETLTLLTKKTSARHAPCDRPPARADSAIHDFSICSWIFHALENILRLKCLQALNTSYLSPSRTLFLFSFVFVLRPSQVILTAMDQRQSVAAGIWCWIASLTDLTGEHESFIPLRLMKANEHWSDVPGYNLFFVIFNQVA